METWVTELRKQFPVTEKYAFFDIAYENCGADFAKEALMQYAKDRANVGPGLVKAGGAGKGDTIEVIRETRELLCQFLDCGGIDRLAFVANTNGGINMIMQGFDFQPGDNVVIGDLEHVSVLMPCLNLKRRGVECKIVKSQEPGFILTAEELLAAIDEHTRMVVVSYVQSASGYRIDLKKLTDECHKRGVYVITDSIQALGFIPFSVKELGVDAMCASGYKGLLAGEGTAVLYVSRELTEKVEAVFAADSPVLKLNRETMELVCSDPGDIRKLEHGTISFPSIYMLNAGLKTILSIGMDKIGAHVESCVSYLYEKLTGMGYEIVTPYAKEHRCHSLLIKAPGSGKEMKDFFIEQGVFVSEGRADHIRAAVAPFTSEDDMEKLLETAGKWLERNPE